MGQNNFTYENLVSDGGEWGKTYDSKEDAKKRLENPSAKDLELGALLHMVRVLKEVQDTQRKILDESKKFYKQMLKEKIILDNLRK